MSSKLAKGVNLDPKAVAAMVEQLSGRNQMPYRKYTVCDNKERLTNAGALKAGELSQAVHLDTNGVVRFPGGMMHPESFRFIAGEQAYQELLARPRVQSEYTEEELSE
jgi:hypothetical protein